MNANASMVAEVWVGDTGGILAPRPVRIGKRCFDILAAASGLVVAAPVMAAAALAIRLESPGPALFRQERIGPGPEGGETTFVMVKFRTMRAEADRATGAVWASRGDPRITRVGRILRATRIDELPQLWNVLTGEMSLVGPRPEQPAIHDRLAREVPGFGQRMYGIRPGITGWAQVEVGYDASLDDVRRKILYDHAYGLHLQSLRGWIAADAWILWRTVAAVLKREGR